MTSCICNLQAKVRDQLLIYPLRNCPGTKVTGSYQWYAVLWRHMAPQGHEEQNQTSWYYSILEALVPPMTKDTNNVYNWYALVQSVCKFHLHCDEISGPKSHLQQWQSDDRMVRDVGCYWEVSRNLAAAVSHRPATRLTVDWWRVGDAMNQTRLGVTHTIYLFDY